MKRIVYILLFACSLAVVTSCNDDFLETKPLTEFPGEDVWRDPSLMEAYVNNLYQVMAHGLTQNMLASVTDEAQNIHNQGTNQVVASNITPSDMGVWGDYRLRHFRWDDLYGGIRNANIFLEEIETAEVEDEDLKNRMIGEVTFLRAYFYHNLMRVFGGVPIVTKIYELDDDFLVPRNTFEETINFIVEEADKAAALLPLEHDADNLGRATKGAALALKSRVLLFAASDLYNNTDWAPGYSNPEYIGYVGGDRTARWQAAKDAAKAVMDLGIYGLYKADPAPGDSTAQNYAEIFLTKTNEEAIFSRFFLQKINYAWNDYHPGLHNGPNGYHNWGGNTPIQEVVDDYEMADGTKFDWNNPEHAAAPYKNRDPRFYASILYNGAKWRQRPSDAQDLDPEGVIQTAYIEGLDADGNIEVIPGLDTRKGPIEDWNGSYTGYYLRKFIEKDVDAQFFRQEAPWHYFRYGEILLNYAEAAIGLGEEAEARTYINMIRRRAGMPEITDTGQALVERYRNERRIELAFEGNRYFDVRRWMIAPEELDDDAHGIYIYGALQNDGSLDFSYEVVPVQDRGWNDKVYFLPIPEDEMNKNEMLVQNPLY